MAQTGAPDASKNRRVSFNKWKHVMVSVALFVRLEAKRGKDGAGQ